MSVATKRLHKYLFEFGFTTAAFLGCASPGRADTPVPLPEASVSACAAPLACRSRDGSTSDDLFANYAGTNQYGFPFSDFAEGSVFEAPDPTLKASISGVGLVGLPNFPGAGARIDYSVFVDTPMFAPMYADVPLDLAFSVAATTSAGTDFGIFATVGLETYTEQFNYDICGAVGDPVCLKTDPGTIFHSQVYVANAVADTRNYISLAASIDFQEFNAGYPVPYSGSVIIDPTVVIDPTFLSSHPGYTLEFSPGIGDTPPSGVPEPAVWTMMLVGVGGAGAMLRGSRRLRSCLN